MSITFEREIDAEYIQRVRQLAYAISNNLQSAGVVREGDQSRAFDSVLTSLDSAVIIRGNLN